MVGNARARTRTRTFMRTRAHPREFLSRRLPIIDLTCWNLSMVLKMTRLRMLAGCMGTYIRRAHTVEVCPQTYMKTSRQNGPLEYSYPNPLKDAVINIKIIVCAINIESLPLCNTTCAHMTNRDLKWIHDNHCAPCLHHFRFTFSIHVSHIIGISDFPPALVLGHSSCVCVITDTVASPGQMTGADVESRPRDHSRKSNFAPFKVRGSGTRGTNVVSCHIYLFPVSFFEIARREK